MTWALLAAGAVAAVVVALVFEPWKLVVDERVQEAAPAVSAGATGPVVLARGTLISHEHESSGAVTVLQLPDGSRVLRLEACGRATARCSRSGWPTRRSWRAPRGGGCSKTAATATSATSATNIGSSNYPIPPDVDLAALPSVSIWCALFHVSFAAARLHPVD